MIIEKKIVKYDWGFEEWIESAADCPYMTKYITIEKPTSLQIHPSCKPETITALTDTTVLVGFRELSEARELFEKTDIQMIHNAIGLLSLISGILGLGSKIKHYVIENMPNEMPYSMCKYLAKLWPLDAAALAPLFLNIYNLKEGQSLYIPPYTPHVFIKGKVLECSGNSNITIRAGLTKKPKDVKMFINKVDTTPYQSK